MSEPPASPSPVTLDLETVTELLRRAGALPAQPAQDALTLGEQIIEAARVPKRHRGQLIKLTPTELTCMRFLGWGRSNADIAVLLQISENTVRVHLGSVARKLELDGMREVAALAGLLFYPVD
ncbi:MAG: LuxR C-terminal-related transcriptional regulator [Thermaurantiacus sp.]